MASTGSLAASQEHKRLMQNVLDNVRGDEPQKATTQCPKPSTKDTPSLLQRVWHSFSGQQRTILAPLHPTAQLLQDEMRMLPPFNTMAAEKLSQLSVAVTIPSWLTNTELACHVATAASRTFGRFISLESPPSAAYTAAGYELCRISYDAFDCTGPGRIMTLEFDGHLAVNSMVNTPLSSWFANPVIFSVGRDLSVQGMAKWIDSFIDPWRPNHLILVGVEANDPLVVNAVANSHAVSLVQELTSALPPKHILAFGAALTAKTILENQPDDCIESTECIELRREADTITGIYKPPLTPSVWPAITAEHGEL